MYESILLVQPTAVALWLFMWRLGWDPWAHLFRNGICLDVWTK